MIKPTVPKGTRDFLPTEVSKRQYIFDTLRSVFETFGYLPIETPAMENLTTLTGKYGEEGDQLLFKVLNNGDFLSKVSPDVLDKRDSDKAVFQLSKRGLRYDLTVPLARYVVMHQNELSFPFKRYQIQAVWRADRPQKGRYQEFYQCDVDILGSTSLLNEAELICIYDQAFKKLNIKVDIRVNHRKVLMGIAEKVGMAEDFQGFTIILDKLDKIGKEGVSRLLIERGMSESSVNSLFEILSTENLEDLAVILEGSVAGEKGIEDLQNIKKYLKDIKIQNKLTFDWTLARGLNYYTGCIYEVNAMDVKMGSIGGGGRYDDLTSMFGLKGVSGVGVSFGAERIYDVMNELRCFPEQLEHQVQLLLVSFDEATNLHAYNLAHKFRLAGIKTDVYPSPVKMKKQMKYANDTGVSYVGIIGESELRAGFITLKNMVTGHQQEVKSDELIAMLTKS
jgi:histidyl-tRNA synthetase